MKFIVPIGLLIGTMTWVSLLHAESPQRGAAMNYRLHCEGCHKPDGSGEPGYIPKLSGLVPTFLCTQSGREYLVRVPGVAQSLLSDVETAEVLNWILATFNADGEQKSFAAYTSDEVSLGRRSPYSDVSRRRSRVLSDAMRGCR